MRGQKEINRMLTTYYKIVTFVSSIIYNILNFVALKSQNEHYIWRTTFGT
jgi:hypothetical protein